ncbi:MAG: twin-arginine translocation signal domain-containing protein [Candidatus Methanoperedens sp.]
MRDKIVEKNINSHCKECGDGEGITSIKLSRRDFVKAASAGGLYLALPNLAKIPDLIESGNLKSDFMDSDPLVVVIKNNELVGFRGLEEFTVKDNGLVEGLSSRHIDEPDSKYSEDDPVVILVKDDMSIKFRGLGEFALEDNDLSRRLSSKFRSKVGG